MKWRKTSQYLAPLEPRAQIMDVAAEPGEILAEDEPLAAGSGAGGC